MSRRRNGLPYTGLQVARSTRAQTNRPTLVAQHVALVHRSEQRAAAALTQIFNNTKPASNAMFSQANQSPHLE